jgi:integrase
MRSGYGWDRYGKIMTLYSPTGWATDGCRQPLPSELQATTQEEILGHATISQTMDTYSHVLPGMQDEATAALDSALS